MSHIVPALAAALAAAAPLAADAAPAQPEAASHGRELPEGAANLDFVIVNRTAETVTAIAITPSGEDSPYSDDLLVPDEVPPGERGAVSYTRDVELCRWDVRATFEGGRQRTWPRIDLCATVRVELR